MCACKHIHSHAHACLHMHKFTYTRTHAYTRTHSHTHMYTFSYACPLTQAHPCTLMYMNTHTRTHAHASTHRPADQARPLIWRDSPPTHTLHALRHPVFVCVCALPCLLYAYAWSLNARLCVPGHAAQMHVHARARSPNACAGACTKQRVARLRSCQVRTTPVCMPLRSCQVRTTPVCMPLPILPQACTCVQATTNKHAHQRSG